MSKFAHKGFTLMEVLIVITISALLVTMFSGLFGGIVNYQSVDQDADTILSYVEKARSLAINSQAYSEYGIRFASSTVTLFQGTTFAPSSSNLVYNMSSRVQISAINLSNGSADVYFNKITGKPNATGTVTVQLTSGTTTRQVIIHGSGFSELQ